MLRQPLPSQLRQRSEPLPKSFTFLQASSPLHVTLQPKPVSEQPRVLPSHALFPLQRIVHGASYGQMSWLPACTGQLVGVHSMMHSLFGPQRVQISFVHFASNG